MFANVQDPDFASSCTKIKASVSKDKETKVEKGGGGGAGKQGLAAAVGGGVEESVEEVGWRPWHQLWPKENKGSMLPVYNPQGKYAVKLYWMVS